MKSVAELQSKMGGKQGARIEWFSGLRTSGYVMILTAIIKALFIAISMTIETTERNTDPSL